MKKTITLILTLALVVLCFAACGKSEAPAATEAPAEASAAATEAPAELEKIIVGASSTPTLRSSSR